jgi:N-acetylmuramoyl-L-alanine amidase
MGSLHRASRRVLAGLAAAGLAVVLLPSTGTSADVRPAQPAAPTALEASRLPLAGKVVGVDPGHNGLNYTSPAFLARKVWNGREWESCDTTGTRTAGGYTEARFTWNVAVYLRADLIRMGARVVMTRTGNHGLRPRLHGPGTGGRRPEQHGHRAVEAVRP